METALFITAVVSISALAARTGYLFGKDNQRLAVEVAQNKMKVANQQAGKLSKKIFKQRLMIKKLKATITQLSGPSDAAEKANKAIAELHH